MLESPSALISGSSAASESRAPERRRGHRPHLGRRVAERVDERVDDRREVGVRPAVLQLAERERGVRAQQRVGVLQRLGQRLDRPRVGDRDQGVRGRAPVARVAAAQHVDEARHVPPAAKAGDLRGPELEHAAILTQRTTWRDGSAGGVERLVDEAVGEHVVLAAHGRVRRPFRPAARAALPRPRGPAAPRS